MEEILKEIQLVKYLLIVLISLFGLIVMGVVYIIYKTATLAKSNKLYSDFSSEARELLDKGLCDDLIQKAKERIETHPKDKWAHWYLAEAYREKGEYTKALEIFTILEKMAPRWKEDYIEPNIREIKETLKSIKPEVL